MSVAYLTPKGQVIKASGIDNLSSQNAMYNLSYIELDSDGQLVEFTINNANLGDLENTYIYVDKTHYLTDFQKEKGKIGYLKMSYFVKLKNNPNKTFYEINEPSEIDKIWFDGHFQFATNGDVFYIEKVLFDENLAKYYEFLKQSFKINSIDDIDFRNHKTFPTIVDLNEQSSDFNDWEVIPINRLNFQEGNFFETNIEEIRNSSLSVDSKIVLYKKITSICFAIYWIRQEVLDIVAISPINTIQNAVENDTIFSLDSQQQPIFSEIDRVIGQLLIDWGFKDFTSTRKLVPVPNNDFYYDGYYTSFSNYQLALDNFYHNLRLKNEAGLFPNNDSYSRIEVLKDILPSSAWSILPYSFRRNIIDSYIIDNSMKGEQEVQCLRIIHSFYLVPTEGESFLNYLLEKKDGKRTNFERLFRLFNDDDIQQISPVVGFFAQEKTNRRHFIYALSEIWKKSIYDFRYIPPNTTPNSDGINPNAFFLTPAGHIYYDENSDDLYYVTLEFSTIEMSPQYSGNSPGLGLQEIISADYYIDEQLQSEKIHITKVLTHNFPSVNQDGVITGGNPSYTRQEKEQMYFHLYQPVNLVGYKEYEDLKEHLPEDPILPAFVYYYCKEYDHLKDVNAAWSTATDISLEVILFFTTGGASIIKDLRYLKHVTKIGKALRATAATQETVLTLRGTEVGFELFTVTTAICYNAANYIATTTDDEAAKKVARLFFWLTMLGAGATIYARTKATRAAKEITANTAQYNSLPNEVKPLVDYLAGAENAAFAAFKTNLQTNHNALYQKYIQLGNIGGVDYQRIFMQEFKNATPEQLGKLNSAITPTYDVAAKWKSMYDKGMSDRKVIDVLADETKVTSIVRYFDEPSLRDILEPLSFEKRWKLLNEYGTEIQINNTTFQKISQNPNRLELIIQFQNKSKSGPDVFDKDDMLNIINSGLNANHIDILIIKIKIIASNAISSFSSKVQKELISINRLDNIQNGNAFTNMSNLNPSGGLKEFKMSNKLIIETKIFNNSALIATKNEKFISGSENAVKNDIFNGIVPIDIKEPNYINFEIFKKKAYDLTKKRRRENDTELKYIFNFLEEHWESGDKFLITFESTYDVCESCQSYFAYLFELANKHGKKIEIKSITNPKVQGNADLKKLLN